MKKRTSSIIPTIGKKCVPEKGITDLLVLNTGYVWHCDRLNEIPILFSVI